MEDKDIKKLLEVLSARDDLMQEDFSALKFEFESLRSSMGEDNEKTEKLVNKLFNELEKMNHKLHGHEKSISKIARKLGVILDRHGSFS